MAFNTVSKATLLPPFLCGVSLIEVISLLCSTHTKHSVPAWSYQFIVQYAYKTQRSCMKLSVYCAVYTQNTAFLHEVISLLCNMHTKHSVPAWSYQFIVQYAYKTQRSCMKLSVYCAVCIQNTAFLHEVISLLCSTHTKHRIAAWSYHFTVQYTYKTHRSCTEKIGPTGNTSDENPRGSRSEFWPGHRV
jgi:negative regulator of genetic competence, sporulation and motility